MVLRDSQPSYRTPVAARSTRVRQVIVTARIEPKITFLYALRGTLETREDRGRIVALECEHIRIEAPIQ
jgi:hypothetical protein